ncbi:MAG: hypothetical protein MUF87_08265 [Anaerolineae bacterium]|jgi:hypothetical protein|nr:hypothetical protein [Anaerolineae bacterium]
MTSLTLHYLNSIPLPHQGDCRIIGFAPDLTLFVEEIYTDDAWGAQHQITLEGEILQSVDEDYGKNKNLRPLTLPEGIIRTHPGWHAKSLNFLGPRHRGMRALERVDSVVHPLSIQDKQAAIRRLNLPITAPAILGLAESYVVSEAEILRPNLYIVCRRLRLAYLTLELQQDQDNQPYDYDTAVLYVAHWFDRNHDQEISLDAALNGLPHVTLYRPMDCVARESYLVISDGGNEQHTNRVHVWRVERPIIPDNEMG